MKKENKEEKQIGPGMWAWDIPEEKKQPNQEFIRKIAQESGQELYSFALLNIFETLSSHVCETCGEFKTAKLMERNSWLKTLCNKCSKGTGYENIKE